MREKALTFEDTREKILYLLKTRGSLSVSGLARALTQSGVNIRRHLDALERDRFVASTLQRRERGRPTHLYHLTEQANELFPQAYDVLSADIFEQIERNFGRDAVGTVLQGRADKMIGRLKPALDDQPISEKIERFSRLFNEMGYLMDVEPTANGEFRLLVHHCPVLRIAGKYPEVCDEDSRVLRESLGVSVRRECALSRGSSCCRFLIAAIG